MLLMLPLGATNQSGKSAWVTWVLVIVCVATFLFCRADPRTESVEASDALQHYIAEHPALAPDGNPAHLDEADHLEHVRLVDALNEARGGLERRLSLVPSRGLVQHQWLTHAFIHLSLWQLLSQLLFLIVLGPMLEEAWGRRKFAVFLMLTALTSAAVQFWMLGDSGQPIAGIAGAVAGCLGAMLARLATHPIRVAYVGFTLRFVSGVVNVPAWVLAVVWPLHAWWQVWAGVETRLGLMGHVVAMGAGAALAVAMKALGRERALRTIDEERQEAQTQQRLFIEARSAMRLGHYAWAREQLEQLRRRNPDYPGADILWGEVDVWDRQGTVRLERALRACLRRGERREVESAVGRLWPQLTAEAFTDDFAWELTQVLASVSTSPMRRIVDELLKHLAASRGVFAARARAQLEPKPVQVPAPGVLPRIHPAKLRAVRRDGLTVTVEGIDRDIPYLAIEQVEAGMVPADGRRQLWVDLVVQLSPTVPKLAVRLSEDDPAVPALYPTASPIEAWRRFIMGVRRMVGIELPAAPWENFESSDAMVQRWSGQLRQHL